MVGNKIPVPKNARSKADRQISAEEFANSEALGSGVNVPLDDSHAATSAVNQAYKDNYRDLCNYANSFLHSKELAQDCVHQAFVGTLTTVQGGEQLRDMRGFLVSCVRNNCLSHLRKSKRESSYSLNEEFVVDDNGIQEESSSAATSVEIKTRWKKVKGAIDDLPSSQKSALLMAEFQGYSYSEIADQMHRSNNSVRQLISRARQKVRATADAGADWATIPAPAIEIDRMLAQNHFDVNPNILDLIQAKTSELQTWVGGLLQSGADNVLHPATAVATGAAIVALAATSPAPPADSVSGESELGSVQNSPVLAQNPANSSSSRSGKTETSSSTDASQPESDTNGPGPTLGEDVPPDRGEGGDESPAPPKAPGKGKCSKGASGSGCGDGKSEGDGDTGTASNDRLDSSSSNATASEPINSSTGSCSAASVAISCISSSNLVSATPSTSTVSAGNSSSTTTDRLESDGSSTSNDSSGTTDNGSSTSDTGDSSLGSADNSRSLSPFTSVKTSSVNKLSSK